MIRCILVAAFLAAGCGEYERPPIPAGDPTPAKMRFGTTNTKWSDEEIRWIVRDEMRRVREAEDAK